jgi:hypothetical protein
VALALAGIFRGHSKSLRGETMTTFNEREKAFENKFARDQELRFKATARRNRMLGQWAAGKLGLSGEAADAYVKDVIRADFAEPGDDDVLAKVAGDFKSAGLAVEEAEIRAKMSELLAEAVHQIETQG